VELASRDVMRGGAVVLAIDPEGVVELLERPEDTPLAVGARGRIPVRAACLDVALNRLPRPSRLVAFDLGRPLYFSVHSASARLAPEGVAVIHVMKYLGSEPEDSREVERELEAFIESLQPGWRAELIDRRFLPGMIVANGFPRADEGGLFGRPGAEVEGYPNIFLAGDWIGPEGMLADASAASAREAARRAVLALSARPSIVGGIVSHATT
jgi:phytoene dehydrogenase-like protein